MDIYMANAMFHVDETMRLIRKLASDKKPKKEAAEARTRLKSAANILHCREKERSRKKFAEWVAQMVTGSVGKLHSW